MLFEWHKAIMLRDKFIQEGQWRSGIKPMQVISGTLGKEKVHFEALPSVSVPQEIKQFIQWFNATNPKNKNGISNPVIRAVLAHIYFETIHPFEDGNGRVGLIITEKVLSQNLRHPCIA